VPSRFPQEPPGPDHRLILLIQSPFKNII